MFWHTFTISVGVHEGVSVGEAGMSRGDGVREGAFVDVGVAGVGVHEGSAGGIGVLVDTKISVTV
jgi:hypothetical protein